MVVTNNTRIGRVKIPSCIACDRPLLEKVRHDKVKDSMLEAAYEARLRPSTNKDLFRGSMHSRSATAGGSFGSGFGNGHSNSLTSLEPLDQHQSVSTNFFDDDDVKLKLTKDGRPKLESVRLPVAQRESSPVNVPDIRGGGGGHKKDTSSYVLRGGFKMPRTAGGGSDQRLLSNSMSTLQ